MESSAPAEQQPLRILVIDDDSGLLSTLSRLLKSRGHASFEATDGESGVALARSEKPDLIICDVTMPKMDGYEVLRALKRDLSTAAIPFIFLSGNHSHDFVRLGMGLGADDYLIKPFLPQQLLDSIHARIERQRLPQAKLEQLRSSLAKAVPAEFFTPLNAILGFSMLMLDAIRAGDEISRDDLEDSMQSIHNAGEQLLRTASNYVLYTQLISEADLGKSVPGPLAAALWEPEVSRAVRKLTLQRGRMKDLHYSFAPATLLIKREHLEKIVHELLDNALKFSRPGQWVSATGHVEQGEYVIRVTDHGCGMTDEQIESIAPMVQFDRHVHVQAGLGLGLHLCRLLAARAGGGITFARNDQSGLTVEVRLPCVGTPEEEPAAPQTPAE